VKLEVGLDGVVMVPPAPVTIVQVPVPTAGVLPAKVTDVAQTVWSGPALEVDGLPVRVITTSSLKMAQGALVIVQRKV
jgi:hypothetical protein